MSRARRLPSGWISLPLAECGTWSGGGTPSKSILRYWTDGTIPWVSPKDVKSRLIGGAEDSISAEAVQESSTKMVPAGSVLIVTRSGILERTLPVGLTTVPVTLNQDIKAISPHRMLDAGYLAWSLAAFEDEILRDCRKAGTTVASIETSQLQRFAIPIAPLPEQRRIVAVLEEQLSDLDSAVEASTRARGRLQAFKASYLQALIGAASSLSPMLDGWPRVRSISLGSVFNRIDQGWSPKCESISPAVHEWGVIRTTAVQPLQYLDSEGKRLPDTFMPRPELEIRPGDLLVTRKGPRARAGVACVVEKTREKLMICDTVYRIQVNRDIARAKYVSIAMNSPEVMAAIDRAKAGISESGVSLTHDRLGAVQIPLPDLESQARIERECDALVEGTTVCASEIALAMERAVLLRRALLRTAFEGALVPEDRKGGSASALLSRIHNTSAVEAPLIKGRDASKSKSLRSTRRA